MELKQAELRQAELVVQRLDLYAAISGQACDANLVSQARQAYESNEVIIGNVQRELDALHALRPPVKTSKASSSKLPVGPEEKTEAQTLTSMCQCG